MTDKNKEQIPNLDILIRNPENELTIDFETDPEPLCLEIPNSFILPIPKITGKIKLSLVYSGIVINDESDEDFNYKISPIYRIK